MNAESSSEIRSPVNHFNTLPSVEISPGIMAYELISPSGDRSMSAHKIWIPPNVEYPPHTHPSPHVIIVFEGGGYGKIGQEEDTQSFEIQAGSVFSVPANIVHQVGADTKGMIMIAFSTGSMSLTDPRRLQVVR